MKLLRASPWEREISNSFTNSRSQIFDQCRQVVDNCCAHHTEINSLIIVNQPVAHSYNVSPWDRTVSPPRLFGNTVSRLAYNFHQLYQSELHHLVLFQLILTCRAQYFYRLGGINSHGNKTYIVIIRAHTELRLNRQSLP